MQQSIYGKICSRLHDGILPEDFYIENPRDQGSHHLPGALDGLSVYLMGFSHPDASGQKLIARAVAKASEGDVDQVIAYLQELCKKYRAVDAVDELQNYIRNHVRKLNMRNIYHSAVYILLNSREIEVVKLGMEILEIFVEVDDHSKETLRRLALYEEFTLPAVWNMRKWENANEELFALAKKVRGWGRIHVLEYLDANCGEIKDWLVTEGGNNLVDRNYTAMICWQQGEIEDRLKGKISREEYKGISYIIEGLLKDEPAPGISALQIDYPELSLRRYLRQSEDFSLTEEEYDVILSIKKWAESQETPSLSLIEDCDRILAAREVE